jgi:predicted GIY-YIG superfamily endonuclease
MPSYVYILECADGSYYTGSTHDLNARLYSHEQGFDPSAYTFTRRPVKLAWFEETPTHREALMHEKQIKGWSRAKKEALIRGDWNGIHEIVRDERKRREKTK